jgi:DNA end-binding protein Ku
VRLFSATEPGADIRFNLLAKDGGRLKQQYINERTKQVVERKDMVKGYEVEDNQFVSYDAEAEEWKAIPPQSAEASTAA